MKYQDYELAEIKLPKFKGYKYTGEYRAPRTGDTFMGGQGEVIKATGAWYTPYPILEKVKWKPGFDEKYLYICTDPCAAVVRGTWSGRPIEEDRYKAGNCYPDDKESFDKLKLTCDTISKVFEENKNADS